MVFLWLREPLCRSSDRVALTYSLSQLAKTDGMRMPVSFISLRLERVDNLGAYRIPPETGILIPSDFSNYR
jgi:hypothetical protein